MEVKIHPSWKGVLEGEFDKPYFQELVTFVKHEYSTKQVFPQPRDIFNAFEHCTFDKVKVVILGQDPYHGSGQAHGLSFSVRPGVPPPPSLINIYKEIQNDLGKASITHGDLTAWADQGVLLLNAVLTVEANKATSHRNKGWEKFTDAVIQTVSQEKSGVVFILWGSFAQKKVELIDTEKHFTVSSPHPSPLSASRGFFGSKPFSTTNEFLEKTGNEAIEW